MYTRCQLRKHESHEKSAGFVECFTGAVKICTRSVIVRYFVHSNRYKYLGKKKWVTQHSSMPRIRFECEEPRIFFFFGGGGLPRTLESGCLTRGGANFAGRCPTSDGRSPTTSSKITSTWKQLLTSDLSLTESISLCTFQCEEKLADTRLPSPLPPIFRTS